MRAHVFAIQFHRKNNARAFALLAFDGAKTWKTAVQLIFGRLSAVARKNIRKSTKKPDNRPKIDCSMRELDAVVRMRITTIGARDLRATPAEL